MSAILVLPTLYLIELLIITLLFKTSPLDFEAAYDISMIPDDESPLANIWLVPDEVKNRWSCRSLDSSRLSQATPLELNN